MCWAIEEHLNLINKEKIEVLWTLYFTRFPQKKAKLTCIWPKLSFIAFYKNLFFFKEEKVCSKMSQKKKNYDAWVNIIKTFQVSYFLIKTVAQLFGNNLIFLFVFSFSKHNFQITNRLLKTILITSRFNPLQLLYIPEIWRPNIYKIQYLMNWGLIVFICHEIRVLKENLDRFIKYMPDFLFKRFGDFLLSKRFLMKEQHITQWKTSWW